MAPEASIIVCTRNRVELLEGCLQSLLADGSKTAREVVVVDNGSSDETPEVMRRWQDRAGEVRLYYQVESRLGLSHARNRGIAEARGRLLLFTDDDVLVEDGWADQMCAGFSSDRVVAVAGRVVPEWPVEPPRWLDGRQTGLLAITHLGDRPRDLEADEVPMGANMGIRASALAGSRAPFDPRLGHQGTMFFAFEEHELFRQLGSRGRFAYCPDAVVRHRILPERMTWPGMRRASVQNGFGSRRAERLRGAPAISPRVSVPALLRAYGSARRVSSRNGGRDDVDPEAGFDEIGAYWNLGRWIEVLLGGSPLGAWVVTRVA